MPLSPDLTARPRSSRWTCVLLAAFVALALAVGPTAAVPPEDYPPGGGPETPPNAPRGPGGKPGEKAPEKTPEKRPDKKETKKQDGKKKGDKKEAGKKKEDQKKDGKKEAKGKDQKKEAAKGKSAKKAPDDNADPRPGSQAKGPKEGGGPKPDGAPKEGDGKKQAEKKKAGGKGSPSGFEARVGVVRRTAVARGPDGIPRPPWKRIDITGVGFRSAPKSGTTVTVVPFSPKTQAFELKVETVRRGGICAPNRTPWHAIGFAPANRPDLGKVAPYPYRAPDVPIDAAVLYPVAKKARLLPASSVKQTGMPKGFLQKTVRGAIDLDDDGRPDLLFLEYCCRNRTTVFPSCLATCGTVFRKDESGNWKVLGRPGPC